MKRIVLFRHAECEMNRTLSSRVGGRQNSSPLTSLGEEQATALGHYLAARYPQLGPCYASPAVRATGTLWGCLEAWSKNVSQAVPLITKAEELQELSQGEFEGQLRSECYTPAVLEAIAQDVYGFAAPGGESQRQVEERMVRYIRTTVIPALEAGGPPALVCSHGFAIKSLLRSILGSKPAMTRKVRINNTGITELHWCDGLAQSEESWEIICVNDTTHLTLANLSFGTSS